MSTSRSSAAATLLRTALLSSLGLLAACGDDAASPMAPAGGSAGATGGLAGGGGSGTAGGAGTAGAAGAVGTAVFRCDAPAPSALAGFELCDAGAQRRTTAVACAYAPRADYVCNGFSGTGKPDECTKDSDCTAKPNGVCNAPYPESCTCSYGCATDDDCGAGSACLCGGGTGHCAKVDCRSNADCASGSCVLAGSTGCSGGTALACSSPADTCQGPQDCSTANMVCTHANGHFTCEGICISGRPLLVGHEPRAAVLVRGVAWG